MKTPFYALAMVFILNLVLAITLYPSGWYKNVVEKESVAIHENINEADALLNAINESFKNRVLKSGVLTALQQHFIGPQIHTKGGQIMSSLLTEYISSRLEVFQYVAYVTILRLKVLLFWLPFVAIFAIPALYDSFNMWQIRKTSFDYPSPFYNFYASEIATLMSYVVILFIFIPFPLPHMLFPLYLFAVALLLSFAIAHSQKRI